MRTFAAKFALVLVPLAAMIAINVWSDPDHVIRSGPEPAIAQLIASGTPAGGILNFDDRLVLRDYFKHLSTPLDVMVLGSSRGMEIRASLFAPRRFLNASVTSATPADFAAIVGELDRTRLLPRQLVIEVDPQLLNGLIQVDSWRAMTAGYNRVMLEAGLPPASPPPRRLDRAVVLVSPAYFQAVMQDLMAHGRLHAPDPVGAITDDAMTMLPDGSRLYPAAVRSRTEAEVDAIAATEASRARRRADIAPFTSLDPTRERDLDAVLAFLAARGTRVTLLDVPLQPTAARLLRESGDFSVVMDGDRHIRALAARRRMPFVGSLDAETSGCAPAEFYDSNHPRESCVSRILRTMALVE